MKDYSTHFVRNIESKSSKGNYKVIFLFFIFIVTFIYLILTKFPLLSHSSTNNSVSSQVPSISIGISQIKSNNPSKAELLPRIEKEIGGLGGTFSVYIYDINNNVEIGLDENMVLTAASVNKIPILAALYNLSGKGEIDLEKVIVIQPGDVQDYGTGSIRYDPPGSSYSIKTLARLMMEKSDNTAAYILGSHIVGLKKIQNLVNSWDLTQTDMVENKSSVKDMSILMIKMYHGEITTPPLTTEMMGFMDKSDFDDRIPAGLPENVKFYHKTGDEIGKIHDAGIIDLKNRPYFLGVFTTDMKDEVKTKKAIANISKIVFEYMTSL